MKLSWAMLLDGWEFATRSSSLSFLSRAYLFRAVKKGRFRGGVGGREGRGRDREEGRERLRPGND